MRGRGGVIAPRNRIIQGGKALEIWIPRGGDGKTSGSGPSGWKMRKSKVLARSLAGRKHGKGK